MEMEQYRQILLAKEKELSAQVEEEGTEARGVDGESAHTTADQSVDDDIKGTLFIEGNSQWRELEQVRAALQRIDSGTFGKCAVDQCAARQIMAQTSTLGPIRRYNWQPISSSLGLG